MSYASVAKKLVKEKGVEISTMMNSPCLRYKGDFMAMLFEKQDALIIKVSPKRVDELIASGVGLEFKFTGKKFKEWVLIPSMHNTQYEKYICEALEYAKN